MLWEGIVSIVEAEIMCRLPKGQLHNTLAILHAVQVM